MNILLHCRRHFATELANNKLVRLIFNGQVLDDTRTLLQYNVVNDTTIHALITDSATPTNQTSQPDVVVFNAGVLMVPLFIIILGLLWYLRYEYPALFNLTSTVSLASITLVFFFCIFTQNRPPPPPINRQRRYGVNFGEGNRNN